MDANCSFVPFRKTCETLLYEIYALNVTPLSCFFGQIIPHVNFLLWNLTFQLKEDKLYTTLLFVISRFHHPFAFS